MHVTRKPVQLGNSDRASPSVSAGFGQGGGEPRAAVKRVCPLARLDLCELGDDLEPLGLGEAGDGGALGVDAKPERPCSRVLTRK